MVEISTIVSVFEGLNAAVKILKGAVERRDNTKINAAVSDILAKLMEANTVALKLQEKHAALLNEKSALEAKLLQMETWNAETARYELKERAPGVLAYAAKEDARGSEPAHWICPQCYEDGRKSVLQQQKGPSRAKVLNCSRCDFKVSFFE